MHDATRTTSTNTPGSVRPVVHRGLEDADLGRSLAYGTLLGIPIMWAVGFLLMLPVGAPVAFGASLFVGCFIGPFVGALILMLRRLVQIEHGH